MQAEIIAIGSELTSGAKLDTNSQWLSEALSGIGIPVCYHSTMADDRAAMLEVFQTAARRSDLVLITGGLGPTLDDLTRELMAELIGAELVIHEPSLEFIREMFTKRGRRMPERNDIQAMFPDGSEPLDNPIGTAPGIWLDIPRDGRSDCRMAAMPGVPSEMKRMYLEQVLPRLSGGDRVIRRSCLHCFGEGESAIEEMLGDLTARDRNPEVGITASKATITLRINVHGKSVEECDGLLAETESMICDKLGDLIFGRDDDTLEDAVTELLSKQRRTLATVEAGTRGMLGQMISTARSSDECYLGGVVVSGTGGLGSTLGMSADELSHLISEESARQMARHCRERFDADYAMAITPFSKPAADDEISTAYVALAGPDYDKVRRHMILNDMSIARPRAAKHVLNMLRLHLLSVAEDL